MLIISLWSGVHKRSLESKVNKHTDQGFAELYNFLKFPDSLPSLCWLPCGMREVTDGAWRGRGDKHLGDTLLCHQWTWLDSLDFCTRSNIDQGILSAALDRLNCTVLASHNWTMSESKEVCTTVPHGSVMRNIYHNSSVQAHKTYSTKSES